MIIFAFCVSLLGLVKLCNFGALFFPKKICRIIRWGHAQVFECVFFASIILLRPLGYFFGQIPVRGQVQGRPILLIHGYLHDSSAWFFLKQILHHKGFGPIYAVNLFHPFRSILAHTAFISKKAQQIAEETNREDLIIIGHSMGGLIGSLYATDFALNKHKISVITIGSPLAGTRTACFALGQNGKEMRYHSSFIQALRHKIMMQKDVKFYHVASATDQLIIPKESALMEKDTSKEYVVDGIGHISLLFSPRVACKIAEWLRSA